MAAGNLSAIQWLSLQWHLAGCADCRARRRSESLATTHAPVGPPLPFGLPAQRPKHLHSALLVSAVVAASLVVFVSLGDDREVLRAKGGSRFDLWLTTDPPSLLGSECSIGQTVQPRTQSAHRYLAVVGIDPAGARLLYPMDGERSGPVPNGNLPHSWTFDGAQGTEHFVALFSDTPLDRTLALAAASATAPPRGVERIERRCIKSRASGP